MKINATSNNFLSFIQNGNNVSLNNTKLTDNINKQIQTLKDLSKTIENDSNLSLDEKKDKQKQIGDQITELQQLLENQRKEAMQEKTDKKESANKPADSADTSNALSDEEMQSFISAGNALSQVHSGNAQRKSLEGKSKVLESEIKLDKTRGLDVTQKEKQLADMKARIANVNKSTAREAAKTNHIISDASSQKAARANDDTNADKATETSTDKKQTGHVDIKA